MKLVIKIKYEDSLKGIEHTVVFKEIFVQKKFDKIILFIHYFKPLNRCTLFNSNQ